MAAPSTGGSQLSAFAPTVCEPNAKKYKVTQLKKPWTITHATRHENAAESTSPYTIKAEVQTVVKATVTVTVGGESEAGAIFAKVKASAGFAVAGERAKTTTTTVSVTTTMKPRKTYVFFSGVRKVSVQWALNQCNSRGTAVVEKARGTAKTFGAKTTGAVQCGINAKAGSLAAKVEKTLC